MFKNNLWLIFVISSILLFQTACTKKTIDQPRISILKESNNSQQTKYKDTLIVNYIGTFVTGEQFDAGNDFQFTLGKKEVISGWETGIIGMRIGEKRKLIIPANFAYGSEGVKNKEGKFIIPPDSTLIFQIELVKIN